jgi:hypothetical protein
MSRHVDLRAVVCERDAATADRVDRSRARAEWTVVGEARWEREVAIVVAHDATRRGDSEPAVGAAAQCAAAVYCFGARLLASNPSR